MNIEYKKEDFDQMAREINAASVEFNKKFKEKIDQIESIKPEDTVPSKEAKQVKETVDNLVWLMDLKKYEQEIMKDVKREFGAKLCDGNLEEYLRISDTASFFPYVERYYTVDLEKHREAFKAGNIWEVESGFDCSLDLDQACLKYVGCTVEEARIACAKNLEIEHAYNQYLTPIRLNYKGSLGELVGKNEAEYREKYPSTTLRDTLNAFGEYLQQTSQKPNDQQVGGPTL